MLEIAIDKQDSVDCIRASKKRAPAESETYRIIKEMVMSSISRIWWLLAALLPMTDALTTENTTPFSKPDYLLQRPAKSLAQYPTLYNRLDLVKEPMPGLSACQSLRGNPDDVYWDNSISPLLSETDGFVSVMMVFDSKLIVGGQFTKIRGVTANNIAAWDGSTWSPLGTGSKDAVSAIAIYGEQLIATGRFLTTASDSAETIASWDGSVWLSLGAGDPRVSALLVVNDSLFVGGDFDTIGTVPAIDVACWDGSNWSAVGSGFESVSEASAASKLVSYHGRLVAAWALFADCELACTCCTFFRLSTLDEAGWVVWQTYTEVHIGALAVIGDTLMMGQGRCDNGCSFPPGSSCDDSVDLVQEWDGNSWVALSSGCEGNGITAMTTYDGRLVTAGYVNIITSWDGSSWHQLGSGVDQTINAMAVYKGNLIIGGRFTKAGDKTAANLAIWTKRFLQCGDADGSGDLNLVDIVYTVNWMFACGPAPVDEAAGDYNCDGRTNIADAVYLINYVFRGGPQPCEGCK
jgi:hypothetical protein